MNTDDEKRISRADFFSLALSVLAALISLIGAVAVYSDQVQFSVSSLWPLPGLVLLIWAVIGVVGFVATYLTYKRGWVWWKRATWFISGTYVPLVILGAFSIGPIVLIAFLLYLLSTILLAIGRGPRWLENLGILILGGAINLGILLAIISLANPKM